MPIYILCLYIFMYIYVYLHIFIQPRTEFNHASRADPPDAPNVYSFIVHI